MLLISEATILFFKKSYPSRKIFFFNWKTYYRKIFFDGLLGWFTKNLKKCIVEMQKLVGIHREYSKEFLFISLGLGE